MESGLLRQKVQIQEPVDSRAADGSMVRTWNTVTQQWASIEPLRGRELWEAQKVKPNVSVRIRMPYVAGLTTAYRIVLTKG